MMRKATSPVPPPPRKPERGSLIPDDYIAPRWSDDDLRRVLALSTLGVALFGAAWLTWRSTWLLWPAGISALALQLSATMIAARSAVASREPREASRWIGRPSDRRPGHPTSHGSPPAGVPSVFARLLPPAEEDAEAASAPPEPEQVAPSLLARPGQCPPLRDATLHRAFFRRIVEVEFEEHPPGLVWPDLGNLQGSLSTRLRLLQRHSSYTPVPAPEVSEDERSAHSPWGHLNALDAADYRRGDTLARLSHRAFIPLAFLELHARMDIEQSERESLEVELSRLYTVGCGRILTPPTMLSVVSPLSQRVGGEGAIALADDARLALRGASSLENAERSRCEWHARALARRGEMGWSGEVLSLVQCLVDYWLVQRAAAADMEWAEELARFEGGTLGAAFAQRDATDAFHFASALRLVCGGSSAQDDGPTAAATVA